METTIKPGLYRHYKGNLYRVIGVGKHSETLEELVLYEALYNNPRSKLWVRPLAMFRETVEVEGQSKPRFEYLEDTKRASVGVGVLVVKDSKILLLKRTGSHGEGTWSAPGGHIDFGESPEATAVRETKEEVGIEIADVQFKAITNDIFPDDNKHYITVWMQGRYTGGQSSVASKRELTDVDWFAFDELPTPLFVPLKNLIEGHSYPSKVKLV